MTRHLLVSVQAYGDNVVAMRLLRELKARPPLRILGTRLSTQVAALLGFDAFPIVEAHGATSALFNVREAGFARAAGDFLALRAALRANLTPDTTVLFTSQRRRATHRLLQLAAGGFRYLEPAAGVSAYSDRRAMFERAFGQRIELPATQAPPAHVRRILIAPATRHATRDVPPEIVRQLVDYATNRGAETCLVDPMGRYAAVAGPATRYLRGESLPTAFEHLRRSDLVVCGDSLFLHLAYYAGVAALALVPEHIARAFYFAPPGLAEQGLFLSFDEARSRERLHAYLGARLQP